MDRFNLSSDIKKQFRRPRGVDKHPNPPSIEACKEAIVQGLRGGSSLGPRDQKDLINIVDRWAQSDNTTLDDEAKNELAERFKKVHHKWKIAKYLRFLGSGQTTEQRNNERRADPSQLLEPKKVPVYKQYLNEFQDAAQDFLSYAETHIIYHGISHEMQSALLLEAVHKLSSMSRRTQEEQNTQEQPTQEITHSQAEFPGGIEYLNREQDSTHLRERDQQQIQRSYYLQELDHRESMIHKLVDAIDDSYYHGYGRGYQSEQVHEYIKNRHEYIFNEFEAKPLNEEELTKAYTIILNKVKGVDDSKRQAMRGAARRFFRA